MKKRNGKSLTSFFLLLLSMITFASGCGGKGGGFELPSLGDSGGTTIDGTSDGVTDTGQFYVGIVTSPTTVAHVRRDTSFNSKCSISPTDAISDVTCLIDVPEGDLYTNGLTLKYNVPPNMCRYFRKTPYWFYNQEVGIGPTAVAIETTTNASGDVTNFRCGFNGGGLSAGAGCTSSESSVAYNTSEPTCVYDLSKSGGKNCCFGEYSKTITAINPSGSFSTTTVEDWGGDLKSCIAGPGLIDWPSFTKFGIPTTLVESAKFGLAGEFALSSVLSKYSMVSNIPIANYYTMGAHTHSGFVNARVTTKPYFIDPVDDRSGTSIPPAVISKDNFLVPTSDNYTFECLDEAWKVKHRISVYIREWDTFPEYLNYISSSGSSGNPDLGIVGTEPGGCTGVWGPCNDQHDIDDFVSIIGGYDTSAPAVPLRRNYFPKIEL